MLSLVTPDNLPEVLAGVGGILATIGGWTFWRARREPPKPGTPDAMAVALAQNTRAQEAMGGQFGKNLEMFAATLHATEEIARDINACREHLSAIRDGINRRP